MMYPKQKPHYNCSGPPGMGPMNPRMNPPRGPGMGPMGAGTYGPGMRGPPPNSSLGPGGMPPMGMGGGRPQWQPNTSSVSWAIALFNMNNRVINVLHCFWCSSRWTTRRPRPATTADRRDRAGPLDRVRPSCHHLKIHPTPAAKTCTHQWNL